MGGWADELKSDQEMGRREPGNARTNHPASVSVSSLEFHAKLDFASSMSLSLTLEDCPRASAVRTGNPTWATSPNLILNSEPFGYLVQCA